MMVNCSVTGGGFGFVTDNVDNFESIVWNEQGAGCLWALFFLKSSHTMVNYAITLGGS